MKKLIVYGVLAVGLAGPLYGQVTRQNSPAFRIKTRTPIQAYAFDMNEVRLLDGPFKRATHINGEYLLRLEPDRLLSGFRSNAGLEPKGQKYGGWEQQGIAGHSLGHYLSACSLMYGQTGDERFGRRVEYIVDELAACQEADGDGYTAAIPRGKEILNEVSRGQIKTQAFNLNGCWVPLYTLHKQLAGLIDAYRLCGNDKAITVATRLADFVDKAIGHLNNEQMQTLLACEQGGLNEAMANLYAITANERYLLLAKKIYHKQILDPLAQKRDDLAGKHSNTQVPKVIGAARIYELTGEPRFKTIAEFFWQTVIDNHTYVNGGNSAEEYFGPPGKLADRLNDTTETCNTYNMLKLTRHLFSWHADARYADYYERALYNHILAHQHPETGMFVYKGFLKPGTEKHYSSEFDSFWCCVGTGMENHSKYGDSIYFHDDDGLYVNLFIASELTWQAKGLTIRQDTRFPEISEITLRLDCREPVRMPIRIRRPYWAVAPPRILINGKPAEAPGEPASFITLTRTWRDGDVIEMRMPMTLRTEAMPDDPKRLAFMSGPIVLCAEVTGEQIPVLLAEGNDVVSSVEPVPNESLTFVTKGLGRPEDVRLIPLYKMHDRRYTVFFDVVTQTEWTLRQEAFEHARRRLRELQARTMDAVTIGDGQSERSHEMQGERTSSGQFNGERWRHAFRGGWFSYELKISPNEPADLMVRYWGSDAGQREFDILIDGEKIATQALERNQPHEFFYATYKVPESVVQGKEKVTVRFQAHPGRTAGGIFDCRIVRRLREAGDP